MNKLIGFYYDGFKAMTVGRRLWILIILKLIIIFGVLKIFFFSETTGSRASECDMTPQEYVRSNLTR